MKAVQLYVVFIKEADIVDALLCSIADKYIHWFRFSLDRISM